MSDGILKYWPILAMAGGILVSAGAAQFQLNAHAGDLTDLSESVDENEDAIEQIQRQLIQRQGEVALQVQRIETQQQEQGKDLDQILLLLQQLQRPINGN